MNTTREYLFHQLGRTGTMATKDIERMQEILLYSKQDAIDNGDKESAKWLQKTYDLLSKIGQSNG